VLKDAVAAQAAGVQDVVTTQVAQIKGTVETQGAELKDVVTTQVAQIKGTVETQGAELKDVVTTQVAQLKGTVETQGAELKDVVTTQVAQVKGTVETQGAELKGAVEAHGTELKSQRQLLKDESNMTRKLVKDQGIAVLERVDTVEERVLASDRTRRQKDLYDTHKHHAVGAASGDWIPCYKASMKEGDHVKVIKAFKPDHAPYIDKIGLLGAGGGWVGGFQGGLPSKQFKKEALVVVTQKP
jgi:hypothetical protein